MNMKKSLALAAVAVATVAGASTNYVEVAAKNRNLCTTVRAMGNDPELADPVAFRATLEPWIARWRPARSRFRTAMRRAGVR